MAHDVTIDDDAIDQGFAEFEQDQPAKAATGVLLPEPTPSEWVAIARMAATMLANAVTPNWQVPNDVRDEWAAALAGCLEQLFPGGLANIANWGPWAKLAYASVMWGMCGVDFSTGTLKPLRPPKDGEDGQQQQQAQAAAPVSAGPHMMG